jgi:hypothetical protein
MAIVLGLFHVLSYLPIPLALVVFRNKLKTANKHPFLIPFGKPIALFVFVVFTCLFAMAPYKPVRDLFIMFTIFQIVFIALNVKSIKDVISVVRQCFQLFLFFVGLLVLVWLAPQNSHILDMSTFVIATICFAVIFFFILCYSERNDIELIEASVNIYR